MCFSSDFKLDLRERRLFYALSSISHALILTSLFVLQKVEFYTYTFINHSVNVVYP